MRQKSNPKFQPPQKNPISLATPLSGGTFCLWMRNIRRSPIWTTLRPATYELEPMGRRLCSPYLNLAMCEPYSQSLAYRVHINLSNLFQHADTLVALLP